MKSYSERKYDLAVKIRQEAEQETDLDFLRRYTSDVASLLRRIDPGPVLAAVSALHAAWKGGKVVLFCGNGGSGASCSHIVNDFQKEFAIGKNAPFKALSLSDCQPLVSAWANDYCWEDVFLRQVAVWGEPGAVLVCVSGSGNSENILNALETATARDMRVIGISGFDGGWLAKRADISIHVPTDSMQQAEDVHMVLLHLLYLGLKRRIEATG